MVVRVATSWVKKLPLNSKIRNTRQSSWKTMVLYWPVATCWMLTNGSKHLNRAVARWLMPGNWVKLICSDRRTGPSLCQPFAQDDRTLRKRPIISHRNWRTYRNGEYCSPCLQTRFDDFNFRNSYLRLNENEFLITPHDVARWNISANDIVHIKNGKAEAGKNQVMLLLCTNVFMNLTHRLSIISTQATNQMLAAISG